jgi:uncharacterized protein (TIGR03067 family)
MPRAMCGCFALCLLAVAIARADGPDPEPPSDGLTALKGTWKLDRMILKEEVKPLPAEVTFTFAGDKLTRVRPAARGKAKGPEKLRVKIDTKKKPATIELIPEGGERGTVGIYKIEKDELFLAQTDGNPADCSGDEVPVSVMKRVKEKDKGK